MLLHDKLKDYRLLLASQSPRRQQLLTDSGIPHQLAPRYECEEIYPSHTPVVEVAEYLSSLKSTSYPEPLAPNDILLTADTVVVLNGEVLGKPLDRQDAERMIGLLSGACHRVITGVTLRSTTHTVSFSAHTDVHFRHLLRDEIDYYLDTYRPYDKAGSYGIQEWIGYAAIERIEGSFYNVMGLPIQKVYVELSKFIE